MPLLVFTVAALSKLTKNQLSEELKQRTIEANAQLENLIDKNLYDYSNTMQRYHQVRLEEAYIGRVVRTGGDDDEIVSAKFLTGTSNYTKNQLIYRLMAVENFLNDVNVQEDRIRQQQENLARKMFNMDETEEVTEQQIEDTKAIWNLWRKLGMSRDHFAESDAVLTEIVKQYEIFGKDTANEKLEFVKHIATAKFQFDQQGIIDLFASGHTDNFLRETLGAPYKSEQDESGWDTIL